MPPCLEVHPAVGGLHPVYQLFNGNGPCKDPPKSWGKYGYGSIPINTIFSGMNIHLPAILMFTRGTRFWHTAIWWPSESESLKMENRGPGTKGVRIIGHLSGRCRKRPTIRGILMSSYVYQCLSLLNHYCAFRNSHLDIWIVWSHRFFSSESSLTLQSCRKPSSVYCVLAKRNMFKNSKGI